jgi:hypothetical protein
VPGLALKTHQQAALVLTSTPVWVQHRVPTSVPSPLAPIFGCHASLPREQFSRNFTILAIVRDPVVRIERCDVNAHLRVYRTVSIKRVDNRVLRLVCLLSLSGHADNGNNAENEKKTYTHF